MNSEITKWSTIITDQFENKQWTEKCQGLTTDGSSWFIVSSNETDDYRAVRKFGFDWSYLGSVKSPCGNDHIGDPGYYNGKIYDPVEGIKTRVWI